MSLWLNCDAQPITSASNCWYSGCSIECQSFTNMFVLNVWKIYSKIHCSTALGSKPTQVKLHETWKVVFKEWKRIRPWILVKIVRLIGVDIFPDHVNIQISIVPNRLKYRQTNIFCVLYRKPCLVCSWINPRAIINIWTTVEVWKLISFLSTLKQTYTMYRHPPGRLAFWALLWYPNSDQQPP